MRGRKVIFAFIWPLLPNSLDCGQNIYRGTIKVIHRHRKSQPFENSVKIKHCLSFFHLHFSPELSKAKCQPRIFFRFSVRLSLITLIIYPIFDLYDSQQDLAAKWQQTHTHTHSRWAITAERGVFTRHADVNSGAVSITQGRNELHSFIWHTQGCQLLQRELEGLSMLEYKSFSDRRLFTDSHCSFTGPAEPTNLHTQRVCHFKSWCTVLNGSSRSTINLSPPSWAQTQVCQNWLKIIKRTKEELSLKCCHLVYVCVRVLNFSTKVWVGSGQTNF